MMPAVAVPPTPGSPGVVWFRIAHDGKLEAASTAGVAMVRDGAILALDGDGRLRAPNSSREKDLQEALICSAADGKPRLIPLARKGARKAPPTIVAIVARMRQNSSLTNALHVFVVDLFCQPSEPARLMIAEMLGLAKSEAKLAWALFDTGSLAMAVSKLSLNRNTAKTQLNNVFQKTATQRQGELIRTLSILSAFTHLGD